MHPYDRPVARHEYPLDEDEQAPMLAWLDGARPEPATARGAATVLLLREAPHGEVQVYLLRRRASMAFAPLMHAFPGGGVDPRDSDADLPWIGPTPAEWGLALRCPAELAAALVCAAVRELFEECGVLLAGDAEGEIVMDVSGEDWERDRLALLDRSLALSDLLVRRQLSLRSDLLRAWAHWTTPEFEPRRFDTWFFVAALPDGQQTRDVGGEADHVQWLGVEELVRGYESGRLAMYPPTVATVADVATAVRDRPAGVSPVEAALASPRRLRRVMPWVARTDEGTATLYVDLDGRGGGRPGPDDQRTSLAALP